MYLRTRLITALCIGLNSSLCTGGIFAVGAAAANQFAYSQDSSGPMSYGSIGYLSCKSSQRTNEAVGTIDLGCKNATPCFTQANSILEERLTPLLVSFVDSIPIFFDFYDVGYKEPNLSLLARVGPLYEDSSVLVHSLLKLE